MRARPIWWTAILVLQPLLVSSLLEEPEKKSAALSTTLLSSRENPSGPEPVLSSTSSLRSSKLDVGTKDAPVDGLDGKPHLGPFVDASLEPDKRIRPMENVKEHASSNSVGSRDRPNSRTIDQVPEDGVMNDPNRQPPRTGTTGTEGGVSEKDKLRLAAELVGERQSKTPDPPKEVPVISQDERKRLHLPDFEVGKKLTGTVKAGAGDSNKPKGAPGIEKPKDLPNTPHDIPHPKSPILLETNHHTGESLDKTLLKHRMDQKLYRFGSGDKDDDDNEEDDDDDEEEGIHDLIKWDSLAGSFSSIAATEIGDKTFIVAALMAMRHPRLLVLSAAYSALIIMTLLSGIAGHAVGAVISKRWAAVIAAILFLAFGAKSLREGYLMRSDQGVSEEIEEVRAELEEKEAEMARMDGRHNLVSPHVLEAGRASSIRHSRSQSRRPEPRRHPSSSQSPPPPHRRSFASAAAGVKNLFSLLLSPAWVETFSMTFIGELGDRSQIATVAMAAGQEYFWVMVGSGLAHFVCTVIAVLGGSVLAGKVSMRKVTLTGGAIFVAFGFYTVAEARQYWY